MKLPNWVRVGWWAVLVGFLTWFLIRRSDAFLAGVAAPADVLAFLIWVGLMLAPVFQEVSFFGVTFKQRLEELRQELVGLRADIRNTVDVTTSISPTIHLPSPPPDTQLPALEERITGVLEGLLQRYGIRPSDVASPEVQIPDDTRYLFQVRYAIEQEFRRLWTRRMEPERFRRPLTAVQMASSLVNEGFLDPALVGVIRDVYSVASPAIHGVPVTPAQVAFVRDVAPRLLATLRGIG